MRLAVNTKRTNGNNGSRDKAAKDMYTCLEVNNKGTRSKPEMGAGCWESLSRKMHVN